MPGEVRTRRQAGIGAATALGACRGGVDCRLQIGGRVRGRAHIEHGVHVYDAGGVEAQRLVERHRALPRVERRHAVRGEVNGSGGSRRWTTAAHAALAGEGAAADWGQGTGRSAPGTSGT
eukprot:scaffold33519_cov52-Phaeocystis_antarctica.AAC.1